MRMRRTSNLWDAGTAVLVFVIGWLADAVNRSALDHLDDLVPATDILLLAAITLPLALRRRYPLTVLGWVTIAFLGAGFANVPEGTAISIALFVALFSAGAYSSERRRDLVRVAAIFASMVSLLWFLVEADLPGNVVLYNVFSVLINTAFFVVAWLMGDMWRKRSEDQAELIRRAEQLERQRQQLVDHAVADERLRIAQELHDVVAHHVSLMGVQAGAARRTLPAGADDSARLLQKVESAGREAVNEMGRLVGFLRDTENGSTTPLRTLEDLEELISGMESGGLEVDVHRVGRPQPLDTAADLAAYRVIQEALTNALKYGSTGRAIVEITYLVEHLSIRVRNPAGSSSGNGSGRGLIGMQERISLSGGTLEAGPRPDGSFEVVATLPYKENEYAQESPG